MVVPFPNDKDPVLCIEIVWPLETSEQLAHGHPLRKSIEEKNTCGKLGAYIIQTPEKSLVCDIRSKSACSLFFLSIFLTFQLSSLKWTVLWSMRVLFQNFYANILWVESFWSLKTTMFTSKGCLPPKIGNRLVHVCRLRSAFQTPTFASHAGIEPIVAPWDALFPRCGNKVYVCLGVTFKKIPGSVGVRKTTCSLSYSTAWNKATAWACESYPLLGNVYKYLSRGVLFLSSYILHLFPKHQNLWIQLSWLSPVFQNLQRKPHVADFCY